MHYNISTVGLCAAKVAVRNTVRLLSYTKGGKHLGVVDVYTKIPYGDDDRITATIEATIRQILQCNYNDCAKSLYQEGKILELVAAFANEMMDQNSVAVKGELSRTDSETLLRVRRQIDEGFLEPVTIAELSKQHFMCESKLREIFRKHYGITIYQYMLNRRMEHACELLSAPDAQVKDIAGLVGYSNISHFSDAFRKKFGCTPSEYKRSLPF